MNNLKLLRDKKGVSQKVVADFLGVTPVQYGYLENEKRAITQKNLEKLSEYYDVSIDYILGNNLQPGLLDGWKEIEIQPVPEFTETAFKVPLVASLNCGYNSAGHPIYDIYQHIELPPSYKVKYGEDIVLIKATGESMLPTIRPRDLLICKPGSAWENGNIVVVNIEDADTIKRIYHAKDKGIDLIPDNQDFRTMHFTPNDLQDYPPYVLGRIVRNMGQDL